MHFLKRRFVLILNEFPHTEVPILNKDSINIIG